MNRAEIISDLSTYFNVSELVCNHTYAKYKEQSWNFLDTNYLYALLIVRRDILKAPMTCNYKGHFQRGLRCNRCDLVRKKSSVYLSAHVLGKAGDFTVKGMTAEQARSLIKANANLLPCQCRLEEGVSWLHFDVRPTDGSNERVVMFRG